MGKQNSIFQPIIDALNAGYRVGCWSSGGRVPIVSIMNPIKNNKVVASGEGGTISESLSDVKNSWESFKKV